MTYEKAEKLVGISNYKRHVFLWLKKMYSYVVFTAGSRSWKKKHGDAACY
jgi:hypothetical protein